MRALRILVLLLAAALFVQNTCPHGFAGKTTVGRSCGACSLKQHHGPSTDQQTRFSTGQSPAHYPLFLFSLPQSLHVLHPRPLAVLEPVITDRYTDAEPAELLRPPRA